MPEKGRREIQPTTTGRRKTLISFMCFNHGTVQPIRRSIVRLPEEKAKKTG